MQSPNVEAQPGYVVGSPREIDHVTRQRLGRQPGRKMRSVVVTTHGVMCVGACVVDAYTPTRVDVTEEEAHALLNLVERDTQAIEAAKAGCNAKIAKRLAELKIAPGTAEAERAIKLMPYTWQATFRQRNDRDVLPLVGCELIGEPFIGHPDGLHTDGGVLTDDDRQANIIAKAMGSLLPAIGDMVERAVAARLDAATAPSKGK